MLEKIKKKGKVKLPNGNYLTLEQNFDKSYDFELFIYVEGEDGRYIRLIAIVRPYYVYRDPKDNTEEEKSLQVIWKNVGDCGIVKNYFEVLCATDEEDFTTVSTMGKDCEEHNYIILRDKQELGMAPNPAGNTELVYIPLYDGYGVQAVLDENDNEVIIGLQHGLSWWQNLCRIRITHSKLLLECYNEYERSYSFVKHFGMDGSDNG